MHVDEGDQYKVGRIEFQGNTKTRDKVIRRNMGVQEGRLLNAGALRNSLLRIRQLEFFKVDEEDPVQFDFDNEEKEVNLNIKGEEGDRTELLFGGGFSELDGLFGQFQFKTRNFLGRGETLAASLQSGRRQDVFDISYFIPFFLDRPQNVGIQAFQRRLDYEPAGRPADLPGLDRWHAVVRPQPRPVQERHRRPSAASTPRIGGRSCCSTAPSRSRSSTAASTRCG